MSIRSSLLVGFLAVVASTTFGATTMLTGCSGGGDAQTSEVDLTATQLDLQTKQMFGSPGESAGSIESSLPGVKTWAFYGSQAGVVIVGADASGVEKVKIAAMLDGDMNFIASGFSQATDVTATPKTIAETLNKDIEDQVPEDGSGEVGTSSLHPEGLVSAAGSLVDAGKALVKACGTTLLRAVGGALVSAAGVAGGAILATTCETGIGCVAAGYAARTGVTAGIGIACPNLPIGVGSVVKSSPAM